MRISLDSSRPLHHRTALSSKKKKGKIDSQRVRAGLRGRWEGGGGGGDGGKREGHQACTGVLQLNLAPSLDSHIESVNIVLDSDSEGQEMLRCSARTPIASRRWRATSRADTRERARASYRKVRDRIASVGDVEAGIQFRRRRFGWDLRSKDRTAFDQSLRVERNDIVPASPTTPPPEVRRFLAAMEWLLARARNSHPAPTTPGRSPQDTQELGRSFDSCTSVDLLPL